MDTTKRQDLPEESGLPPGLWVVATPIGNLSDLTARARLALERADVIVCEDTRRTQALLAALGIRGGARRLERLDAHAAEGAITHAVDRLQAGKSLALVTDAGTPAISDPGARIVAAAREAGVRVVPVPGASAVTALLSASGFGESSFAFSGFFPRQASARAEALEQASSARGVRVFVWFESPERIEEVLGEIAARHPGADVVCAKELTKLHERIFAGKAGEVAEEVRGELAREGKRGEWCFAVRFAGEDRGALAGAETGSDWIRALRLLLDAGVPASDAARRVSQSYGVSRKIIYDSALKISGKKSSEGD